MDKLLKHSISFILLTLLIVSCSHFTKREYSKRTSRRTSSFDHVLVKNIKNRKKARQVEDISKLVVKSEQQWSVLDLFRSEQKRMELQCPDETKRKRDRGRDKAKPSSYDVASVISDGASIRRSFYTIHFDIIELEEDRLDIPAFKQFKNNMTDFTADGEAQFEEILRKIRHYLGDNTDGSGVTLNITGSASQIPTSFDPEKPNNNIRKDGSSIPGQTSIENNKKLAQARATELAKKIQAVFINISIEIPEINDIKIGETVWNSAAQTQLNDAFLRGDKKGMNEVYGPFQKDQWVKVESKETITRTIKPNSIRMHTIVTSPGLSYLTPDGQEIKAFGKLVVSKTTYNLIGGKKVFATVDARDQFLSENKLELYRNIKDGKQRWYLLTRHESNALHLNDEYERIYSLYEKDIIHHEDKRTLQKIITKKYKKMHQFQ